MSGQRADILRECSPPTMCHMRGVVCHVSHIFYPHFGVGGGSVINVAYLVCVFHPREVTQQSWPTVPPTPLLFWTHTRNLLLKPNFKQTKIPLNVWTSRSAPPFPQKMSKTKKKKILKQKHNKAKANSAKLLDIIQLSSYPVIQLSSPGYYPVILK